MKSKLKLVNINNYGCRYKENKNNLHLHNIMIPQRLIILSTKVKSLKNGQQSIYYVLCVLNSNIVDMLRYLKLEFKGYSTK